MELKNLLTPWNWFKKEEEQTQPVRVRNLATNTDHRLSRLHYDLETLFDQVFQGFPLSLSGREQKGPVGGKLMPQVDITESQKDYTITIEIPGVKENDIDLSLLDGNLTIRGEKREEHENHDKHYHRIERSYGSFRRILSLPADADENTIKAKFADGVLRITIEKDPQAKSSMRKIAIG